MLQNNIEYLLGISLPMWKLKTADAFTRHASRLERHLPGFSCKVDW